MNCEVNLPDLPSNMRWRIHQSPHTGSDYIHVEEFVPKKWYKKAHWKTVEKAYITTSVYNTYDRSVMRAAANVIDNLKFKADPCRGQILKQVNGS